MRVINHFCTKIYRNSVIPGTYFLKYARDTAEKLGLRGWVKLSHRSTVIGQIQGEKERVDEM